MKRKGNGFISCYAPCDNQFSVMCRNGTAKKYHLLHKVNVIADKRECPYYKCREGLVGSK
jgi:hypothetical protein